ncbi:Phosphoesterasee, DHH-like [Desulfonema limicola]|uniref:Phosphoesterasee, DHH-like n=1 Tax=Desulfonema limicola TaxID=45656 RepID=A0A975BA18_9BACT|nr:CBS domain-containing protein [Desulfonema limicola]QTA81501.1 Phosphoesterasee, DHH-like [Desulfonema limicola]
MQIVTTHKSTDFDALASVIAATIIYPDALPVIPRSINPNVKAFLSIHKDIFNIYTPDEIDLNQVDRLIVVDVNKWDRLDLMKKLKHKEDLEIFLWDHHPDKGDINANQVCHEPMGANITLMIRHLKLLNKQLTPVQASLFLTGIHEDTGNLMFPSTMPEDARAAAYLMENKADLNVVGSWLRPAYGEKQKSILFDMLNSCRKMKINGYNICINKVNIEGHVGSLSLVVNMCREILNVDAVFGIFTGEKKAKSIIIGRSNADGLNIGSIMKSMGGGGHPGAGSAMLKFVNPDTVEQMIVDLIEGNQQSSIQISDLMSFPVVTVPSDMPMKEVGKVLREKGCTGVPVVEDDRIVGIISRRDFRKIKKKSGEQSPVKAFMNRNIITIEPGKSPMHAARKMVKFDIGRLPVVDENGKLIGIVTRSDAMIYFYDMLPD